MSPTPPVRVRFAPSPTGRTHLGSGRTALYNYLLRQQLGGTFILRIEDTDLKRFVPGAEEELIRSLHWLGIQWDEGPDVGGPNAPYHQTDRKEIYLEHARWLVEHDYAFFCFCTPDRLEKVRQQQIQHKQTPRYDGACRRLDPDEAARRVKNGERHVIRFKTPLEGEVVARDHLRGDIIIDNRNLDDYVLVKSNGLAVYHLAAMVDDHLMGITHVLRGTEWLSTFPLHVQIVRAFGWQEPVWVHLSVFLKPSGKGKMSKRESSDLMKDGYSTFISDLEALGYVPEAVVNWIALMGWSYNDREEFFTLPEMIERFSLDKLNPAPAAINFTKLDHFNGLHIRRLPAHDLARRIKPFFDKVKCCADLPTLEKISPIIQERIVTLDDAPRVAGFFFEDEVYPDPAELVAKGLTAAESRAALEQALALLESLPEITLETAEPPMRALAEELGLQAGQLFGILRVAVTGQKVSPPLFQSMEIIGREKVLQRLRRALQQIA